MAIDGWKKFLRDLTGPKIPTIFVPLCGNNWAFAAILTQCCYWEGKSNYDDKWFKKTDTEWENELYISKSTCIRARKYLSDKGFIEYRQDDSNENEYKPNWDSIENAISKYLREKEAERKAKINRCQNDTKSEYQNETDGGVNMSPVCKSEYQNETDGGVNMSPVCKSEYQNDTIDGVKMEPIQACTKSTTENTIQRESKENPPPAPSEEGNALASDAAQQKGLKKGRCGDNCKGFEHFVDVWSQFMSRKCDRKYIVKEDQKIKDLGSVELLHESYVGFGNNGACRALYERIELWWDEWELAQDNKTKNKTLITDFFVFKHTTLSFFCTAAVQDVLNSVLQQRKNKDAADKKATDPGEERWNCTGTIGFMKCETCGEPMLHWIANIKGKTTKYIELCKVCDGIPEKLTEKGSALMANIGSDVDTVKKRDVGALLGMGKS